MKILTQWLRSFVPGIPVDDHHLAEDLTLRGIAVEGIHDLGTNANGQPNGHLFEMDITTNRVDAMNHYGIAREAATIYNLPLLPLLRGHEDDLSSRPKRSEVEGPATVLPITIAHEASALCRRFTARILRNITVGPAQDPIARYFTLLGQKQISAPVDASNFTLLAMGQPTHAFDLDKIVGGIIVRLAHPGETLTLLDGFTRTLHPEDLVIADHTRALSLAGVMGGLDSSITAGTRNVLIEAAWFDPAAIRATSRRHLLHTDASHRFERGADLTAASVANQLVANLILAQCGGQADPDLIDILQPGAAALTTARTPIQISLAEVRRHLGATLDPGGLSAPLIHQYLTALGCILTASDSAAATENHSVILSGGTGISAPRDAQEGPAAVPSPNENNSVILSGGAHESTVRDAVQGPTAANSAAAPAPATFNVQLPSWRLDLTRPIDLIEEIARVYGYNRFANTLPTFTGSVHVEPTARAERAVRTRLLALGYSEAISSSFASAADSSLFSPPGATATPVPLENPLSDEAGFLRPSLVPGMLTMLAYNLNRDMLTVRLFESGHIFAGSSGPASIEKVDESLSLTLGITGPMPATPLYTAADAPFYHLKASIESLASLFELTGTVTFTDAALPPWLEPTRAAVASLPGLAIAHFGQLSSAETTRRKLRQPVYVAEIHLADLLALPLRQPLSRELSRFQAVERDFSFTLPDTTRWHQVAAAIHALAIPELQSLTPVEIFRDSKGKALPPAHYSLLLRTVFQSPDRTLRDEELTAWSSAIIAAVQTLGGSLRS